MTGSGMSGLRSFEKALGFQRLVLGVWNFVSSCFGFGWPSTTPQNSDWHWPLSQARSSKANLNSRRLFGNDGQRAI